MDLITSQNLINTYSSPEGIIRQISGLALPFLDFVTVVIDAPFLQAQLILLLLVFVVIVGSTGYIGLSFSCSPMHSPCCHFNMLYFAHNISKSALHKPKPKESSKRKMLSKLYKLVESLES